MSLVNSVAPRQIGHPLNLAVLQAALLQTITAPVAVILAAVHIKAVLRAVTAAVVMQGKPTLALPAGLVPVTKAVVVPPVRLVAAREERGQRASVAAVAVAAVAAADFRATEVTVVLGVFLPAAVVAGAAR